MYQLFKNKDGSICQNAVRLTGQNTFIPFDEANSDYQAYLKWVAEGNTPLDAE